MGKRQSRYEELVIWVTATQEAAANRKSNAAVQVRGAEDNQNIWQRLALWFQNRVSRIDSTECSSYDVWVYTNLELPGSNHLTPIEKTTAPTFDLFKLAIHGRIIVHGDHYKDYLATLARGEKAAYKKLWESVFTAQPKDTLIAEVRDKIFHVVSKELGDLLRGTTLPDRPLRMWWNCTPTELAELPWELLACDLRKQKSTLFSFVRGLPSTPLPKIPVKDSRLRLAFIHDPERTPERLKTVITELGQSMLEVIELTKPPREALEYVVDEGIELVHLVTGGAVSLSGEGLLYFAKTSHEEHSKTVEVTPVRRLFYRLWLMYLPRLRYLVTDERLLAWNERLTRQLAIESCSPSELHSMLHGSRVAVVSLSTPETDDDDITSLDGALLPSVYRAYSAIGNSILQLPNLVAPLGACDSESLSKFWKSFYQRLASPDCYSVEEALAAGLQDEPTVLMSLYLRQRLGRDFTANVPESATAIEEPTRVCANLQVARSLLEQLRAIDENYKDIGSQIAVTAGVHQESQRQEKLEQEIASLTELEEAEL
jgi:hypothetical protein